MRKRAYDVIVIGGGIVGLWTALHAARRGRSVCLLDCCERLGAMTTSRNSGVLHGGVYYAPESLKARHCVRGRHLSVEFLQTQGAPFSICGKYIVPAITQEDDEPAANSNSDEELERLRNLAQTNGVEDVDIRRSDQSFLHPGRVLHVGCTGIVDLPAYVKVLERVLRQSGVEIFLNHRCVAAEAGRILVRNTCAPTIDEEFRADCIVNSAGLYADEIASMFGLSGFEVRPNKGSYFQLRVPLPVQTLVYPLPSHHSGFLGVHYTPDMQANAWAGPNTAHAQNKQDFTPDANRDAFYDGLKRIIRNYKLEDLTRPNKAGLRARLFKDGIACTDFVIQEYPAGVCHLMGIESPGLTSAPSLAQDVLTRLGVH